MFAFLILFWSLNPNPRHFRLLTLDACKHELIRKWRGQESEESRILYTITPGTKICKPKVCTRECFEIK